MRSLLRVGAWGWECALRLLALESGAPRVRIALGRRKSRAHVLEAGAKLGDEFVGVRRCRGWCRVDAVKLGGLDLPLVVCVAGGRNLPGLDGAVEPAGAMPDACEDFAPAA